MEFPMVMQMIDSKTSQKYSLSTAVKNSLRPVCFIPLTAAVFFSSYSYAVGLQEIQIKSHLGEPLNATVLLTNPPAGSLSSNCFTVLPKSSGADFPGISTASARLSKVNGGYSVNISSSELVKEPITSITLASNCSALPIIERTFTMMIDPAGVYEQRVAQSSYTPRNNTRVATDLVSNRTQATRRLVTRSNQSGITQNSSYQIQRGDSLSSIANRIQNTPEKSMWSVAASILATNPRAFIDNNPDYLIEGNTLDIPSFTAEFVPNEQVALSSILRGSSRSISSQRTPNGVVASTSQAASRASTTTPVRYVPVQTSEQALSTMTLSTSLSAISLERIEARANGQLVSDSLLPNTSSLFGSGEEENPLSPQQSAAASPKQAVEPKVVYVDRPAYPSEIDQRINAGILEGVAKAESQNSSSFTKLMTSLIASLVGLGLLSWFVVRPFIKRRNRLAFIRTVRAHKQKSEYISRNKQRKDALHRLPVQQTGILSTEIEEITNNFSHTTPDISSEKTEFELQQHANDIEAAFTAATRSQEPSLKTDSQAVINKNNGPRESNVAKEIYEVGTIDDTGELASLTMAFPELEAELNARLGGNIPDLGKDLVDKKEDQNAETMTVQFERPLEDVVDFELPGLIDNLEGDFESVVKEGGDFASTMVFNEEIFKEIDSINPFDENSITSRTLSTEALGANDETRVSEIMIDEDGLKASDFGLDDEDFPADKKDYSYLEPDASINSPGINLSTEELEELGFADDDNIVPFSKIKQSKK